MKKSIVKSLEPQTKSLFRFKNSDNNSKFSKGQYAAETVLSTDPTITVTTAVTH